MGDAIRSYRDLVVWRKAMELAKLVYIVTKEMPSDERFGLTSQMRRSATSVPANIAEGYGRRTRGEYLQFLGIARGSLRELETFLILVGELEILPEAGDVLVTAEEVGRLLHRLEKSLRPSSS